MFLPLLMIFLPDLIRIFLYYSLYRKIIMWLNINMIRPLPNSWQAERHLQREGLCGLQTNTRISLNKQLCPLSQKLIFHCLSPLEKVPERG